ncbi:MAG: DUF222 domain-containing protein, partial [Actinobacteria bacterium]|nr:DUF222 domain-containing protein [Actinomycetota bacterium]
RLAMTRDAPGERRSYATRLADAAVDICRFFVDHQHGNLGGGHRPHVNVVVDYDDLMAGRGGESIDGTLLDGAAIATLFCDANVHRVVTKGRSAVLDYGRATRVVSRDLWNALVLRDRHCRVEGCDRPSRFCEAHHVVPVAEGGPTRAREPGARVQPAPPHGPRARPLREAAARRRLGHHRSRRHHAHHPTTGLRRPVRQPKRPVM